MLRSTIMPTAAKLYLVLLVLAGGCSARDDGRVALGRELCGEFRAELRSELEWISWLERASVDERREGLRHLDRAFAGPWTRLGLRVCTAAGASPPESAQAEWSQAAQALAVELIRISSFIEERPLTADERAALDAMGSRLADVYAALAGP